MEEVFFTLKVWGFIAMIAISVAFIIVVVVITAYNVHCDTKKEKFLSKCRFVKKTDGWRLEDNDGYNICFITNRRLEHTKYKDLVEEVSKIMLQQPKNADKI